MEHQQTKQLAQERITRLLLRFAIPATVGTFMNSLYNVVDRIFIGQGIGADGLAAAMIAFPIMIMMMAFGMLIAFGSNALISIRLGEKNKEAAEEIIGQAVFLFFCFAILFVFVGLLFLRPMLILFGASESVLPYAIEYTRVIILGVLFHEISFGGSNFIRGEGNPRVAMITMIIGAGGNILLDPIFIFGLDMGMQGAALATVFAQMIASFWVLRYYLSGKSVLKLRRQYFKMNLLLARRVVIIGSPPFVMNIVNVFILAFVNNALKRHGGDIAIAVMGVIFTIYTINFMPIIGISQGAQPIIGYNHGARDFSRVKETLLLSIKVVTLFSLAATALIWLFPRYTFVPFSSGNSELIQLGTHAIRITMSMFPFVGFMVIVSNYFQATARPQISLFLSMLRQVLVLIPLVLILPKFIGVDGVWYAYPISAACAFLTCMIFFGRELGVLNRKTG
ncbi:MATE family efflux transporter [candidate division KSB1 bacterium]|nr:MATE family efflux transporter [candidate division KSB1 bacterium]RQW00915.1 MAG: MATE family efflux transporter [candidate division KSB1 bacterium]